MIKMRVAVAVAVAALALSAVGITLASPSTGSATAPIQVSPELEHRQAEHGMHFADVTQADQARVSADVAKAKATEVVSNRLERPATSVDVKLVRFTYDKGGPDGKPLAQDHLSWKVTFYGTRTQSQGKAPHGSNERQAVDQAVLDQSVTWVLIDATTGETIATYSTSPKVQ